jgi:hypothetical protein
MENRVTRLGSIKLMLFGLSLMLFGGLLHLGVFNSAGGLFVIGGLALCMVGLAVGGSPPT